MNLFCTRQLLCQLYLYLLLIQENISHSLEGARIMRCHFKFERLPFERFVAVSIINFTNAGYFHIALQEKELLFTKLCSEMEEVGKSLY